MKRKHNQIDADESKLSSLLFNKTKKFTEKLNRNVTSLSEVDREPAWIDDDDRHFKVNTVIPKVKNDALYTEKLKQKYETLIGTPNWAKITDASNKVESGSDIVKTVGHIDKEKVSKFDKNILEIKKSTTIIPQKGAITTSLKFHPKVGAVMLANTSGIVSLHSLEGNNKLHSFKLKGWTISSTHFKPDGSEAYISGVRHTYCIYDLVKASTKIVQLPHALKKAVHFKLSPDGKFIAAAEGFSEVFIICADTNEVIKNIKNNSNVKAMTYSHDSRELYCFNELGEVTVWDMTTMKPIKKFFDSGCITPSRISMSHCGRLLATGTAEGIVNIYDTSELTTTNPMPLKTISHLTTKITNITFNPTSEMLSVSSSFFPNALKALHIPSYNVFPNFPKKNLQLIETVGFSPNGGYMGISNNKGIVNLFRLGHFKNY
ncbi:U3 small nucleolar RNA-associated protein 18 homolog [Pieris rapae]|uniref:U3 small nucleolar RNA-associated protein 18 homolog n=1 Tax=Pieris rapae TaxID=64459 RepID=UPI001E27E8E0|nr:U3 small nucleolar RNA-associated protein 18 homolog [Pieris rapae]